MNPGARLTVFAALLALATSLPGEGRAEKTEWNQENATTLAQELKQATSALYDAFYKQPSQTIGSGQARAYLELKQQLRRIRTESQHLAATLAKGEGHDETAPIFRNLMEEVRDAQVTSRRVFSTSPVIEKANAARTILEELGGYYAKE